MSTKGTLSIAYRVSQIKTKKISITEPDHINYENIQIVGEVEFKLNKINEDTSILEFEIFTDFIDNSSQEHLINHIGLTKYELKNLPLANPDDPDTLSIQDNLMVMLYAIAHSHSRALLAADLQNSIYKDKLFIPIVDPKRILDLKPKG